MSGENTVSSSSDSVVDAAVVKENRSSSDNEPIWIPLESDPDIMTDYLRLLTLTDHYLIDVPVIEEAEEMGIFAGHQVKAFIFLYEINARSESANESLEGAVAAPAQANNLFHIKQLIHNSCGSIALFHAYINTVDVSRFEPSSIMHKYYWDTVNGDFEHKGRVFAASDDIRGMHHTSAQHGQSEVPTGQQLDNINYHFVAVLWRGGAIYRMDGRCPHPVRLGACAEAEFKTAGLEAIKKMILRDPENLNFSILAFCGN